MPANGSRGWRRAFGSEFETRASEIFPRGRDGFSFDKPRSLVFHPAFADNFEPRHGIPGKWRGDIDHQQHDLELRAEDVQLLSDPDAVAAFFGRLGYDTNPRTIQTPGNLGITSENTLRRIRKIELIADSEGLLQVYLFQLPTVTVADARALATAFRNRVGNFLLVLTADFERVDFVLLEKYLPVDQDKSIAQPQVKVRPRTLSLERRKPERLQLRVLGRFTWTEADAFAQYEKLLAAYALAHWSEEYFNNRALFSDYFLKERLTDPEEFPEWKEDPKPAYNRLRQIYQIAAPNLAGAGKTPLQRDLIEPAFAELGFDLERGEKMTAPRSPTTGSTPRITRPATRRWLCASRIRGIASSMARMRGATRTRPSTIRDSAWSACWRPARRPGSS